MNLHSNKPPEDLSHGLFVVWGAESALVSMVRKELSNRFSILCDSELIVSEDKITELVKRLYAKPVFFNDDGVFEPEKTKKNKLHVFYVKDLDPLLALHRSAAGEFENVSLSFAKAKEKFRLECRLNYGYEYFVHAALTVSEIRLQLPILFPEEVVRQLWMGESVANPVSDSHLSLGFKTLAEALSQLTLSTEWCVLRGWETLPDGHIGDDLDILVQDKNIAVSCINLLFDPKDHQKRNGYLVLRSGETVKFDLHWVGDGYFDERWQSQVLANRRIANSIPRPNDEDAVFTLLYNELVNRAKPRVERLRLAASILSGMHTTGWFDKGAVFTSDYALDLLGGYMKSKKYVWVEPKVKRHDQPAGAVQRLPKTREKNLTITHVLYMYFVCLVKRVVPDSMLVPIVRVIRKVMR